MPAHQPILTNMDEPGPDHFEMRRLESLSNTIFGVAMTLLAYDLPRAAQFSAAPTWGELAHLYAARLIALTLSFLIAGLFWYSHHRRLMRQPYGSRPVVFANLFFLLSIILLPATTGLNGSYGQSGVIAVLYGLHLSTIAASAALCPPAMKWGLGRLATMTERPQKITFAEMRVDKYGAIWMNTQGVRY
jgi:TMEM175 potassium channel family protein